MKEIQKNLLFNIKKCKKIKHTWISGVEHDGGVWYGEPVILDVHFVRGGQLGVVEDLVDTAGQVPDTVLYLNTVIVNSYCGYLHKKIKYLNEIFTAGFFSCPILNPLNIREKVKYGKNQTENPPNCLRKILFCQVQ